MSAVRLEVPSADEGSIFLINPIYRTIRCHTQHTAVWISTATRTVSLFITFLSRNRHWSLPTPEKYSAQPQIYSLHCSREITAGTYPERDECIPEPQMCSLPSSQETATGVYPEPDEYNPPIHRSFTFTFSSHIRLGFPSNLLTSRFPTKMLCKFLISLCVSHVPVITLSCIHRCLSLVLTSLQTKCRC
jgi:hypothetical protein